jgi:UDPglucose 6-dehydrogenase
MQKIAVMGTGYVGLVSGTCFAEIGNSVICCDVDQTKIDKLIQGIIPIYEPGLEALVTQNVEAGRLRFTTDVASAIRECDIIYIAVGTPMSITGAADMRYVSEVAKTIGANLNGYKIIVNKSTVPVGTGRLVQRIIQQHLHDASLTFDVVSNPEFLREGSAISDCMNMERAVIGATSNHAAAVIKALHEPFKTKIFITDLESAEMIKYASNAFLATKISFINAVANLSEQLGADVTQVAEGMGMDSRIGDKFLKAGIGYGGSCFPKDTHAIVHMAESVGYDFQLMKAVIETNERQKLIVVHKLEAVLGPLRELRVAVLGLAFKPNTNDMRDAPSIPIIQLLLAKGAKVQAFDPIAEEEAQLVFADKINYAKQAMDALSDVDAVLVLTEWQEVTDLDWTAAREVMKSPVVIDGRNCLNPATMRELGFVYHSIGRQ